MEFKNINDCWNAIRNAKTIDEVEKLFEEFPRWSGDWEVRIEDGSYVVYNYFFDKYLETEDCDAETLDIEVD